MATYSKILLTNSLFGAPILVTASTTSASIVSSSTTLIHTTGTSSSAIDEIWLYAHNYSAAAENLSILYGGTSSALHEIKVPLPSRSGLTLAVPGLCLTGNGSVSSSISAFGSSASVITISGYVNRIS